METPAEAPAPQANGRRVFFKRLFQGLAGLWGIGIAAAVFSYLKLPSRSEGSGRGTVQVGPSDRLAAGQGLLVTGDHAPFWVVRARNGELIALPAVCTHRHCILEWRPEAQVLSCPCHAGAFDLNGNVLGGPPPRPLAPLSVSERGGMVYVYV